MFLLRWFSRALRRDNGPETAGSSHRQADARSSQSSQRSERANRREQLYAIVREAMVRVGILSAGYKFKALALDNVGRRFVVMMDLAPAYAPDATQQRNIEALIAELARTRLEISVHAVYWRVNAQIQPPAAAAAPAARPAPAQRQPARPATAQPERQGFEPIDPREMDAFKQAVASATAPAAPARGPLLGPDSDFAPSDLGSLGMTQYGEPR